jgi:hypothetical protein
MCGRLHFTTLGVIVEISMATIIWCEGFKSLAIARDRHPVSLSRVLSFVRILVSDMTSDNRFDHRIDSRSDAA